MWTLAAFTTICLAAALAWTLRRPASATTGSQRSALGPELAPTHPVSASAPVPVPVPAAVQLTLICLAPLAVLAIYSALGRPSTAAMTDAAAAAAVASTSQRATAAPASAGARGSVADAALAATAAALAETTTARHGAPSRSGSEGSASAGPDIEALLNRLTARLRTQPNDLDGWLMLAHSLGSLGRYRESASAYEQANRLAPNDAQLLADWADALAMAQSRNAQGEPWRLLQRALAIDPQNLKARIMSGTAALERGERVDALAHFEAASQRATPGSDLAQSLERQVAALRGDAAQAPSR